MNNRFTNHQGCVVAGLLTRMGKSEQGKIKSSECSSEELQVLNALEESHAHFAGWWDDDAEWNIIVKYDRSSDTWDVYYGNRWM